MKETVIKNGDQNLRCLDQMFARLLKQTKMNQQDFLNQLRLLPRIMHQNEEYKQNDKLEGQIQLGILYPYQILHFYITLPKYQYKTIPQQIRQIIQNNQLNYNINKKQEYANLIIEDMIDANNYEKNGLFSMTKQFSLLYHRLLAQKLIQIRPHKFKLNKILYIDEYLTQFYRAIYKLPTNQYQVLINNNIANKNQKYNYQISQLNKYNHEMITKQKGNQQKDSKQKSQTLENQDVILQTKNNIRLQYENNQKDSQREMIYQQAIDRALNQSNFKKKNKANSTRKNKNKQKKNKNISKKRQEYDKTFKVHKKSIKVQKKYKRNNQDQLNPMNNQLFQTNSNLFDSDQNKLQCNGQQPLSVNLKIENQSKLRNNQQIQQNSQEDQMLFLKRQRQRIYKHAMSQKVRSGTRLFKHSSSARWGNKKPLSQAEQAYALGRLEFVEQINKKN